MCGTSIGYLLCLLFLFVTLCGSVSGFSKGPAEFWIRVIVDNFFDGRNLSQSSELTCPVIASEPLSQ